MEEKKETLTNFAQSGKWIPENEQVYISHHDVIDIICWLVIVFCIVGIFN